MISIHEKIYDILIVDDVKFDSESITLPFSNTAEDVLTELSILYETITWDNSIRIDNENLPFRIYKNSTEYLKLNELKNKEVLIIDNSGKSYSLINNEEYVNFRRENIYFFSNANAFGEFIDFLQSNDNDSEGAFHFIDYFNDATRKIVLTSLSDRGRVIIKFYNEIENFRQDIDLRIAFEDFKKCFSEEIHHLPKFLKSALIEYSTRFNNDKRIYQLFENLEEITNKAKINFEIYLNSLSIDKIVKEYDDYKAKYFKELSDVLNNLTHKVIGLPLVISAALLAVEQSKKSLVILYILILALTITNIYLVILLRINFKDLKYIKFLAKRDFKTLSENNFFARYPNELEAFTIIKDRILLRIKNLRNISEAYYWILGLSNLVIIGLISSYLGLSINLILIFSLVIVFILGVIRNSILENFHNTNTLE